MGINIEILKRLFIRRYFTKMQIYNLAKEEKITKDEFEEIVECSYDDFEKENCLKK